MRLCHHIANGRIARFEIECVIHQEATFNAYFLQNQHVLGDIRHCDIFGLARQHLHQCPIIDLPQ